MCRGSEDVDLNEPVASGSFNDYGVTKKRKRVGALSVSFQGKSLQLAPESEARGYELELNPGDVDNWDLDNVDLYPRGKSRFFEVCSVPRPSAVVEERPSALTSFVRSSETLGRPRVRANRGILDSLELKQVSSLRETVLPNEVLRTLDKAFTSTWVDEQHVMVGTKCNSLLCIDVNDLSNPRRVELPAEPMRPLPEANSNDVTEVNPFGSCGIHAVAVNPSGTLVATGGTNPTDVAVVSVPEDRSRGTFAPLRTFVGHHDWIFGLAWVSDSVLVSASRDHCMRLWSVSAPPQTGPGGSAYGVQYEPLRVARLVNRVREVKYDTASSSLFSICTDGVVRLWDSGLQTEYSAVETGHTKEVVCMAVEEGGRLAAVGSQSHVTLVDPRCGRVVRDVESVDQNHGVRSVAFRGHLLSTGTGRGRIAFYDLRTSRNLDIERKATLGDAHGQATGSESSCLVGGGPSRSRTYGHYQTGDGWVEANNVYRAHFSGMHVFSACYSQSWSPSGRMMFTCGGPLAFGLRGCYMATWR